MNAKAEAEGSALDIAKLALALATLIGAVVGFYLLDAWPMWGRLLGLLALVGVAALLIGATPVGRRFIGFASDANMEVRKVVWPSRQETVQTTLIIGLVVIVAGLFFWGIDSLLFMITRALTGQGG